MGRASIAATNTYSPLPEMLVGPMSSSPFQDVRTSYLDSPQLVWSSMPPFAAMARLEAKPASVQSEAKKGASSEMRPLIAAHVFSWAWRYNLGIKSADAFARDLAGIL